MDETETKLKKEIEKWTKILGNRINNIESAGSNKEFLDNVLAYYSDSKHFFEKKDFIRSFEALLWSFSWLEIGLRYNFLVEK